MIYDYIIKHPSSVVVTNLGAKNENSIIQNGPHPRHVLQIHVSTFSDNVPPSQRNLLFSLPLSHFRDFYPPFILHAPRVHLFTPSTLTALRQSNQRLRSRPFPPVSTFRISPLFLKSPKKLLSLSHIPTLLLNSFFKTLLFRVLPDL